MPPKRTNSQTPQAETLCRKGHSMQDAYETTDKYGKVWRRCATCQKEAARLTRQRKLQNPIYAAARRAAWAAMKAVEQAEIRRLQAEQRAKRVVNA
jgi:hypothetical protein